MNSLPVIRKHQTMAGKQGKQKRSENSSTERQMNISINTPSIPFDKPKKSKDKFDEVFNMYRTVYCLPGYGHRYEPDSGIGHQRVQVYI